MQDAKGKCFQPYEAGFPEQFTQGLECDEAIRLNGNGLSTLLTPLKPIQDETPVVGIDVSSIRIGETETGVICAVRGAVVWNEKRRYRYLRLGPFPFHVNEENRREVFDSLGERPSSVLRVGASTSLEVQSLLCNVVERWVQMGVSYSAEGNVILWDGSLTAGTPGNPMSIVSGILEIARSNSNHVLAFSKATSIRFLKWRITDLVQRQEPPCLFEVEGLPLSILKTRRLLGRMYVSKLSRGGCSFRLDIDRTLSREEGILAVERLLGNELVFQGYPETLRLAHICSTFTANDVMGIQSWLTQRYGLKAVNRQSMRRRLFGPFGTGFED